MTKDILAKLHSVAKKAIFNRNIIDVAIDGIWIHHKDPSGYYIEYDDRFLEIFGYDSAEEYKAQGGWRGNIDDDSLKKAEELMIEHEKSAGRVPYSLYASYTHKDGSKINVLCRGKIIEWNADGSYATFVGSHTVLP